MAKLDIIELLIDETKLEEGIDAISLVESPAIEENFVALSKQEIHLKTIDEEKRIIIGLALIPDLEIYRRQGEYEYNIIFSKDTVRKASELYMKRLKVHNSTLEHKEKTDGVFTIESWIVEDPKNDKTNIYGLNANVGSWAVVQKVENDEVWNDIKLGKYKGFSIEGIFSEKEEKKKELSKVLTEEEELIEKIKEIILKTELESYTDYPKQASENAKVALRYAEENGWGDCGTAVGKARANQLANNEPISEDTISRMASFERHRQNSQKELGDGCGRLMWLAWGGDEGIEWASRKLQQIRKA
jgi:hypothetical protein